MEDIKIIIDIPIFLTFIFIILQICGIINWSWYFILSPILILTVLGILFTILLLIILFILLILKINNYDRF